MDLDFPPFTSSDLQQLPIFPFFDPVIEDYLNYFGDSALLSRDDNIKKVNACIRSRLSDKYQPIICSTSRGMGKTAFMEAIGMQKVKPELKNQLISEALSCGRILSFDFANAAAETAVPTQEDIKTFFTRLMIYFLCRLFDGTEVAGINFEKISHFSDVQTFSANQPLFRRWLSKCLKLNTDDMIDEYIRLTNIAFKVDCVAPPVFLLDEIQGLCKPTTTQSRFQMNETTNHSFLSLLLTQLAGKHKPVCICAGTNSGNLIKITEKSKIIPRFISLSTLHEECDYRQFWNQRTQYLNESSIQKADFAGVDDLINSLVYASYQIPRLLLLAHDAWFYHKTVSHLTDNIAPLQSFENEAAHYYGEMAELLFNPNISVKDIAHVIMCCGVHWKVGDIYSCVPGTNITWNSLIEMSLVFPYLENCYVFPFNLIWAIKTPMSTPILQRAKGDYTSKRDSIWSFCAEKVPNLNIKDLYLSYDQLRQLSLYNLGICYEKLFASSLSVTYYLHHVENAQQYVSFNILYDFGNKEDEACKDIKVDFSKGIDLPLNECFVNSPNLNTNALIHNRKTNTAHHDIILPAKRFNKNINIAVSCKASFELSPDKTVQSQLRISKTDGNPVEFLIWLYLGDEKREEKYQDNVVFMNGAGCCNGLALDMLILTKILISKNNKL